MLALLASRLATSSPARAKELADEALELAREAGAECTIAEALAALALHAFTVGGYDECRRLASESRDIFARLGDDAGVAQSRMIVGHLALERGDWDVALGCYLPSLAAFERAGDLVRCGNAANNVGLVHWRMGNLDAALEYFERARGIFDEVGDERARGNSFNNLGLVESERGRHVEALGCFERARPLLEIANELTFLANVLANMADSHEALGNLEDAKAFNEQALELRERIGHKRGICGSVVALARVAVRAGDLAAADAFAERGLALAGELGLKKHLADVWKIVADAAEARGDHLDALSALRAHVDAKDAVYSDERARRVAEMQARFDANQARADAAKLRVVAEESSRARERAEAASREQSTALAMISHEIKNPLGALIVAADALIDRRLGALTERQRMYVEILRSSANVLESLVGDVLDHARLEAGRLDLRARPFSVAMCLRDVATVCRPVARERGVEVDLVLDEDVAENVVGDPGRLRQALLNLASNAVKFTAAGRVVVKAERTAAAPGLIGLRIAVEDTGIGMTEAELGRLFQPFLQANPSIAERFGGSGLGLAISKRLIEAMGGRIEVESVAGSGTTFRVELSLPRASIEDRLDEAHADG